MKTRNFHLTHRAVVMIAAVLAFLVLAYFFIVPTVVARHYFGKVNAKTDQVKADLKAVSTGRNVVVFEDPDIKLAERQKLVERALASISKAQDSLYDLKQANSLPRLPGNGFAGDYHKAVVRQERTDNAVRQSRQVLDQYAAALAYIDAYTGPQLYLEQQLAYINSVSDFNTLAGQGSVMTAAAARLQADQERLAALKPPPDFAPLHDQALETLRRAADAFEQLGAGLDRSSDTAMYGAVTELERIALKNEVDDKQMVTELALSSPTLLQLAELPEKIEHAGQ